MYLWFVLLCWNDEGIGAGDIDNEAAARLPLFAWIGKDTEQNLSIIKMGKGNARHLLIRTGAL